MWDSEPAQHHIAGWSEWPFMIWTAITVALWGTALWALWEIRDRRYTREDVLVEQSVVGVTAGLGAIAHGIVARHIGAATAIRWWLVLPLAVAGGLLYLSARQEYWGVMRWERVGLLAVGLVGAGWIWVALSEMLQRVAANIPTGVGPLMAAVFGVAMFIWASSTQHRRS